MFKKILCLFIILIPINAFDWDELPVLDTEVELIAALPDGSFAYISSDVYESTLDIKNVSPHFENKRHFKTQKVSYKKIKSLFFQDELET